MDKLRTLLQGKKTYLTAFIGIVAAFGMWVDGNMTDAQFLQAALTAVVSVALGAKVDRAANQ